jgi:AbrB family looped-hinge helix DNA binding protein
MLASKVTSQFRIAIPAKVREKLGIKQGDWVSFEIENGRVSLRRMTPLDVEYAKALTGTLTEWASENGEEAYRDL